MKKILIFLGALAAYGTDCTISDTVRTPFGGYFAGRIVVALNSPGSAQPLYSGSQTLTGWQTTIEVPASANGVVAFTLVCTDTITPSGTSYSARYQPTSGSGWAETWSPTTGTTTIRAMRATTVPTPTTTFQASQIVPGSNGQVITTTAGASAWGSVPACATCVVTSGSYADPAWITSLAGSKVSGAVASSTLAASATALATPRTIAGVSFNGTANISIASTNLSDTANLVRNNAANTYTAGSKQTFAHSATTAGLNVGVQATAPSSPAQGDVFFNTTLTRKGVYDGTQWRYELYAPSSGTGVVSWDGTSLSASTTLAGLSSVTSTSFVGALTGNASTATALSSTYASTRILYGAGTGVPSSSSNFTYDASTGTVTLASSSGFPSFTVAGGSGIGAYVNLNGGTGATETRQNFYLPSAPSGSRRWRAGMASTGIFSVQQLNDAADSIQRAGISVGITGNVLLMDTAVDDGVNRLQVIGSAYISNKLFLGTTTDLGYGLHAANKGTNGNLLVFDPTATTGTTKAVFAAGQGQSGNILEVRGYNATPGSGTLLASVDGTGNGLFAGTLSVSDALFVSSPTMGLKSSGVLAWANVANPAATKDLSLSRASAGVVQVGDGGANANGTLKAAALQAVVANTGYPELVTMTNSSATNGSWKLQVPGSAAGSRNGSLEILDYNGSPRYTISVSGDQTWILSAGVQAASLSSTGTYTLYNQTATTGNTKEVIRAGQGQSTNLTEWQNNAGTVLASVANTGIFSANRISITSDRIDIPLGTSSGLGVAFSGGVSIRGNGTDSVMLTNSTGTGYGLLQFGGTTNSFPALKRSSAILQARLADDSAMTDVQVSSIITKQTTPSASTDACTAGAIWADATYIYACTATGVIKRATLASF